MNKIEHFMLPEHHNRLYTEEAISSISLTRDIADKINELVDAYNTLNEWQLAKHQEQDGAIRKGILYMKDNLLNTLNDLLNLLLAQGYVDDRIAYHCKSITDRLDNLLGKLEVGSTTGDAELIDARTDFTGYAWENVGEHIRAFFEVIGQGGIVSREQTGVAYNNLNYQEALKAGDKIYIEPVSINVDTENVKYISVLGMYGDYAEDGTDTIAYFMPDNIKGEIFTLNRDYGGGIRISYILADTMPTIAYGIIKKLGNDLTSRVYENRVKVNSTRANYNLFEPAKMRFGAHQGYRAIAPANSIPAYEEAGKAGFEWAWIAGCRQSADGTWYVMHDSTVDTTTNGTGAIKEMADVDIAGLAIDTGENVNKYTEEELRVPTVDEVVTICRKYGMNVCYRLQSLYTNVSGIEHFKSFIAMIKRQGMEHSIFSGNAAQIAMLKRYTDNWHGQVYVDSDNTDDVIAMIDTYVSNGWTNMSILATYSASTKEAVEYCHSKGYKYCVSDIPVALDTDYVIDTLQQMGVDICQSGHIHKGV